MQTNILLSDMIQHKFIDVVLENKVADNTSLIWTTIQSYLKLTCYPQMRKELSV